MEAVHSTVWLCAQVKDTNMADYCRCGGKYAQTLSVDAFTQQIRTFGNIARCVCTCVYVCMCMHACMWKFENGKILKNNAMHVISFST